ncbi:MAG: hypothetical protein NZ949_08410, partial [Candidatus Kapabacteria bacterium]|nr:hypothetical protein [Candidatus Kapabacteria bacterium]
LIAGAQHRGTLVFILSLPVIVPLVFLGVRATIVLLQQPGWEQLIPLFHLLLAYSGILAILGFWLFEWVWRE